MNDHEWLDLQVLNAALPNEWNITDPFGSPPNVYAVELSNVDLEDATGHAFTMRAYVNDPVNPSSATNLRADDIYIHNSALNFSAVTGILNGVDFNGHLARTSYDRNFCDSYQGRFPNDPNADRFGFANDPSVFMPRNLRIEDSEFRYNNTGVTGGGARWVGIRRNTFDHNYVLPQHQGADTGPSSGGTIEFDQCTDQLEISGNTFTGPGSQHYNTVGLELYARNMTVSNNVISNYGGEGIAVTGAVY